MPAKIGKPKKKGKGKKKSGKMAANGFEKPSADRISGNGKKGKLDSKTRNSRVKRFHEGPSLDWIAETFGDDEGNLPLRDGYRIPSTITNRSVGTVLFRGYGVPNKSYHGNRSVWSLWREECGLGGRDVSFPDDYQEMMLSTAQKLADFLGVDWDNADDPKEEEEEE